MTIAGRVGYIPWYEYCCAEEYGLRLLKLKMRLTMDVKRFAVGDRVRARIPIHGMPTGTLGTIQRVLSEDNDLYDVQFDDHPNLYAVRRDHLEQANDASQSVHQSVPRAFLGHV